VTLTAAGLKRAFGHPPRTRLPSKRARTKLVNGVRGLAKLEGVRLPSAGTAWFARRARPVLEANLRLASPRHFFSSPTRSYFEPAKLA